MSNKQNIIENTEDLEIIDKKVVPEKKFCVYFGENVRIYRLDIHSLVLEVLNVSRSRDPDTKQYLDRYKEVWKVEGYYGKLETAVTKILNLKIEQKYKENTKEIITAIQLAKEEIIMAINKHKEVIREF